MELRELIEQVEHFLDPIRDTSEMDRTKREEQLLELGKAFVDAARRYDRSEANADVPKHEQRVTELLKAQNAINREYELRDLDADALAAFRKGRK